MAVIEAAAVVNTLKGAADLIDKLRGSDDRDQLRAGVASLADMLVDARVKALDLIGDRALLIDERAKLNERVKALEAEVARVTDFGENSQKYERIRMPGGKFVFREKNPPGGNAGAPFFCPQCFMKQHISILQGRIIDSFHFCPNCKWNDHLNE
ncbi:MAG TPA: hypothetical protein VMU22_03590 [Rhizomicrobium sp.]|nr:hypothetical protein [Rhizomicrobium sp.]